MGEFAIKMWAWVARFLGFVGGVLLIIYPLSFVTTFITTNLSQETYIVTAVNVLLAFIVAELVLPRILFMIFKKMFLEDD